MHLKRWITSILAIPVATWIYLGSLPAFSALVALVALVAWWEYFFIFYRGDKKRIFTPIPLWGALTGMLLIGAAAARRFDLMIVLVWINLMGAAALSMPGFAGKQGEKVLDLVAAQVQYFIYIPLAVATLVLLRAEPQGVAWIFLVIIAVFLGDVGAYYAGTYFGRHKLIPAISPGKTVEGAIGGLAGNLVTGYVFKILLLPGVSTGYILLFVVLIGIFGQLGDLFESEMKRAAKIKDSGTILPGHGGMLDRIDALLFAAPAAFIFKTFLL